MTQRVAPAPAHACREHRFVSDTPGPPAPRRTGLRVRTGIGLAVLFAFGALLLTGFRECSVVTAVNAATGAATKTSTTTTCTPSPVSSALVLVVLLFVVVLFWPDISEVTIGNVTLKRRVEEARSEAKAARAEADRLVDVVASQQIRIDGFVSTTSLANAISNQHQTTTIHIDSNAWTAEKGEVIETEVDHLLTESERNLRLTDTDDVNAAQVQVLQQFEELSRWLGLNARRARGRPSASDLELRAAQAQFIEEHKFAIEGVRELRNAVAHAEYVPPDNLASGLELLQGLVVRAKKALPPPAQPERD